MWIPGLVILMILSAEALEKPRLVYPRLLEERSADGRLALHVHDGLTLNLKKTTVAAPQLRVLTNEDGRSVTHLYDGEEINRNLYEDEKKLASVELTNSDIGVTVRGLVGPQHRIQPMPVLEKSQEAVVPHMIHRIGKEEFLDRVLLPGNENETIVTERARDASKEVPDVINIEMFVVASKPHHHHFTETKYLIWYTCVMVNFANLRLAQLFAPKVKLVLTGLETKQDEPYAFLSRDGFLHDEETLKAFRHHAVLSRNQYGKPDIVFLLSGYDVFTILDGKPTAAGLGIAYLSGLCTDFYVGLGEDMPGLFTGAHTMTHEVAHLLGATHDGNGPDSEIPGHPSAVSCRWEVGNIMSYINKGHTHHLFSRCSLQQMRHVVSLRGRTCWAFEGKGYLVRGTYPGMVVSFQEFCMGLIDKKRNVTFADVTVNRTSCEVQCVYKQYYRGSFYSNRYYESRFQRKADALDYMPCGQHEVCIKGFCVPKPTEEPTSTQSTLRTTTTQPPEIPTSFDPCKCDCSSEARMTSRRPTFRGGYPPRPQPTGTRRQK
uniref:Peptidase M12B domain-containing protein n=1 Tax=Amblyomma maculatum TaxID=34609 RepID=G3MQ40_AMBMU